jgi:inner membrane protein
VGIAFPGRVPLRLWVAAGILSALPDADALLHWSGVPYRHPFGHRGFSHSLCFAALAAGAAAVYLVREHRGRIFSFLFVVTASHGALDAMTNGGLGIAFFAPLSNERYFLPFRPLQVSPIGVRAFFSEWGLEVLATELVWVIAPLTVILVVVRLGRRDRSIPGETT